MISAHPLPSSPDQAVASALRTLGTERDGLTALMDALDNGLGAVFTAAVETIASSRGRVIVTGIGKSGTSPARLSRPSRRPALRPITCIPRRRAMATSAWCNRRT